MKNEHLGSNFDDFLEEEGLRAEAEAAAIKRVIAFQIEQEMKQANLLKTAMAEKMHTSRTALDRLLDPANVSPLRRGLQKIPLHPPSHLGANEHSVHLLNQSRE